MLLVGSYWMSVWFRFFSADVVKTLNYPYLSLKGTITKTPCLKGMNVVMWKRYSKQNKPEKYHKKNLIRLMSSESVSDGENNSSVYKSCWETGALNVCTCVCTCMYVIQEVEKVSKGKKKDKTKKPKVGTWECFLRLILCFIPRCLSFVFFTNITHLFSFPSVF